MIYTEEDIRSDLRSMTTTEFFIKYIIKSPNWYFSEYMGHKGPELLDVIDCFKEIVSYGFGISFHSSQLVGSAKTGFSLSPYKCLKPFTIEGNQDSHSSDIDVAIVSEKLFSEIWESLRCARESESLGERQYTEITAAIFRGYINEKSICYFSYSRAFWKSKAGKVTRALQDKVGIVHPINYRVYRNWEDLQEYQISGINRLKERIGV